MPKQARAAVGAMADEVTRVWFTSPKIMYSGVWGMRAHPPWQRISGRPQTCSFAYKVERPPVEGKGEVRSAAEGVTTRVLRLWL